ncbi:MULTISPECIES: MFS transporter [Vagococcus]|uniref:MFS transporter n=1 Tax=Vagococcus TaxID=2737 RepID=UPI000E4E9E96|nr:MULTISPECIES: MFS transporter [Vagococcus]RHH66552.1 MFS transporter [Vagococcus sp. AM17-17]
MTILFKNSKFAKLTIGNTLSIMGDSIFYLALVTYASRLDNFPLAISLIAISETLPTLFESYFGYLADKTKNKTIHLPNLAFIRAILYLSVGLIFSTNMNAWNIVFFTIIINFFSDLFGIYSSSLKIPIVKNICNEKNLDQALGITNSINYIVKLIAQFTGAGIIVFLSFSQLAYLNAIMFLLSGITFFLLYREINKEDEAVQTSKNFINDKNFIETFKYALNQIKSEKKMFSTIFKIAFINGIIACIPPLFEILVASYNYFIIGTYSITIAIMGICISISITLGGLLGIKIFKKTSLDNLILYFTLFSLLFLFSTFYHSIIFLLINFSAMAFLCGICSPKLSAWLMNSVDPHIISSSVGIINTILMVSSPLMVIIFTSFVNIFSLRIAIIFLTFLILITFIFSIINFIKDNKKGGYRYGKRIFGYTKKYRR